jgi:ribosomal protein S12 methylthiotransferase
MNQSLIDKNVRIIIDQKDGNVAIGRTSRDAPEIDNEVTVHDAPQYSAGDLYDVTVVDAEEYDLFAVPVQKAISSVIG